MENYYEFCCFSNNWMLQWKTTSPSSYTKDYGVTLPLTMNTIVSALGQLVYSTAATDDGATPHVMVTRYASVFTSISKSQVTLRSTQGGGTYKIVVIGY